MLANANSPDILSDEVPPLNVLAAFHRPLKRTLDPGNEAAQPSCDLHFRSFSVRNLEFFTDFALRAAYYLGLVASGPVPLPKKIERWTVIRANFIFAKSKENFERVTYKRLIQIKGAHPDVVEVWLSFLRRYQFYGVGMKADVFVHEGLDVATRMDKQMEEMQQDLDTRLSMFGWNKRDAEGQTISDMVERGEHTNVNVPMSFVRHRSRSEDRSQPKPA